MLFGILYRLLPIRVPDQDDGRQRNAVLAKARLWRRRRRGHASRTSTTATHEGWPPPRPPEAAVQRALGAPEEAGGQAGAAAAAAADTAPAAAQAGQGRVGGADLTVPVHADESHKAAGHVDHQHLGVRVDGDPDHHGQLRGHGHGQQAAQRRQDHTVSGDGQNYCCFLLLMLL